MLLAVLCKRCFSGCVQLHAPAGALRLIDI
jgi:hypothetical protein